MRIRRVLATGMAILIALCAVCGDCSAATVAAKGVQTLEESVDSERTGVEEDPTELTDDAAASAEEPISSADIAEGEEDGMSGETGVTLPDKDDDQKSSGQRIAEATAPKTIKAFVTLEESEFRFDEKPSLEDAIAAFPKKIQAVLEDDSVVEIEVKDWECISDYEEEAESYEFKPVIDGYVCEDGTELPVVRVKNQGILTLTVVSDMSQPEILGYSIPTWSKTEYENKMNQFISNPDWRAGKGKYYEYPLLSKYNCSTCYGYVCDFTAFMYGYEGYDSGVSYTSVDSIQTGDIIKQNGHIFVVLRRDGNALYTADATSSGVYVSETRWAIGDNGLISENQYVNSTFIKGYHFVDLWEGPEPTSNDTQITIFGWFRKRRRRHFPATGHQQPHVEISASTVQESAHCQEAVAWQSQEATFATPHHQPPSSFEAVLDAMPL